MPVIIATKSLRNQHSLPIIVPKTMKNSLKMNLKPSNKALHAAERAKHIHNLEIVLRHSNATPIRGHNDIGYVCYFCPMEFPDPHDLKTHILETHRVLEQKPPQKLLQLDNYSVKLDVTNLTCQCFKHFDQLTDLIDHLRVDHDQTMHTDIKNHMLPFRFDSNSLKCSLCDTEFTTLRNGIEHMNKHYRYHICDICDAGYISRASLRTHIKTHNVGDYQCKHCQQFYNTIQKLNNHIRYTHQGQDKRHKCTRCGKKFVCLVSKKNHLVKEHGATPTIAKCTACDKTFGSYSTLQTHYKMYHLMIKNFKCSVCNMEFFKSIDLKKHMVKHTGARDYKCDICQRAYGRKYTLVQHMRIHKDDRRHKCDTCEMAFVQKCSLKSHLHSKHGIIMGS